MTKTGRNDPCFCGSGKKYKRCCIDSDLPPFPPLHPLHPLPPLPPLSPHLPPQHNVYDFGKNLNLKWIKGAPLEIIYECFWKTKKSTKDYQNWLKQNGVKMAL